MAGADTSPRNLRAEVDRWQQLSRQRERQELNQPLGKRMGAQQYKEWLEDRALNRGGR